jgi:signal transduction histidine kinase/DNA-binding response OmpR family regulator
MNEYFIAYRYIPDKHPPETSIELYTAEVATDGNTLISWMGEDYMGNTPDDRLLFSYRLDGGPWSPFKAETHHTFLNLPSGNHNLEVRARDMDLNVDPTPATVNFQVNPTVWKQKWFIFLMLAFFLIIGIFEYRIITKKQKLEKLNDSLNHINATLKEKNEQVLEQQKQILHQKVELERSYTNLEDQNLKIQIQRDKLEEMVKQVEELSKSKINFFTNISHELRTPLTLILGPVEQLQSTGYPVSEKERRRLLEIVERNAYRLLKLINQLLEIRRIENNTLELNLVKSNLGQFIGEITDLFDNLARETHIHLSFHNNCPNALTAFDPDKVEKIITNLLSNAFKYTPEGGRIGVKLQEHRCEDRRCFQILVEDTGEGISPQKLNRIFDRYYSDSQDQASAGIGLAYLKDLVELHSGKIEVSSTEGEGTVFIISIPDDLDAAGEVEKLTLVPGSRQAVLLEVNHLKSLHAGKTALYSNPGAKSGQRILIVEDNEDMIDFLEGILNKNYIVRKARNGNEALRIARNHHLDLILSDVMMPGMNGLEFCHHIKSDFKTSHIPVILLTAKNMDEHIMEGYTTGADDYMTKPFNPELLKIRIDNLMIQRQQLHKKFIRDFKLQPKEVRLSSPDEELLQRVVEIMEEHISDSDFNVNKMCEMVHLSHMHFIRKMKQLTGKKPIDLLKSYRMKRAKDLLKQKKINIAEIAYMVGYDLPNSFSRAFKKEFGFSPTEFLESLQQSQSTTINPR